MTGPALMTESTAAASTAPDPGETEALRMLVHGIFAITMTLMILDLRVPVAEQDGHLLGAIRGLLPQAVAYFFGFAWLLVNWLSIRGFLSRNEDLDPLAVVLLLSSVAVLSLTPVAVSLLAESSGRHADFAVAVRLAGAIALLAYVLNVWLVLRQRVRRGEAKSWGESAIGTATVIGPVLASIALSFVSGGLAAFVLVLDFLGKELLLRPFRYVRTRLRRS
jgi:uncharacterized membrane protein